MYQRIIDDKLATYCIANAWFLVTGASRMPNVQLLAPLNFTQDPSGLERVLVDTDTNPKQKDQRPPAKNETYRNQSFYAFKIGQTVQPARERTYPARVEPEGYHRFRSTAVFAIEKTVRSSRPPRKEERTKVKACVAIPNLQ